VLTSMTKNTYKRRNVTAQSTYEKSRASILETTMRVESAPGAVEAGRYLVKEVRDLAG
jgi:hypothetical protein